MTFFDSFTMPMNDGVGRDQWFDAVEEWLYDFTHGAAEAGDWSGEDWPLAWDDFIEDVKDNGLDLTGISEEEIAPLKRMFAEMFAKILENQASPGA